MSTETRIAELASVMGVRRAEGDARDDDEKSLNRRIADLERASENTMNETEKKVAVIERPERDRDIARSGEAQSTDVVAALTGLVAGLASGSAGFDDVSVSVTSETTPSGSKSTFAYRAYRHRKV